MLYELLGENDKGIADYTTVIELNPQKSGAFYNRGVLHSDENRPSEAFNDYSKAIAINPKDYSAYNNRSIIFRSKKEYSKAIEDCTKAIEIDPHQYIAYHNRALSYSDAGEEDKAVLDFTKAIEYDPMCYDAYSNRGMAYYHLDKLDEIKKLQCLKTFVVDGAGFLEYLPCEIGELSLLEELVLKESRSPTPNGFQPLRSPIKEIPSQIGRLGSLKILSIPHSSLTSVPQALSKISSLTKIDLHDNKLQEFSTENFPFLTHLNLCQNELTEFPMQIANSPLTFLDISNNNIATIPREIGKMSSLLTLNFAQNNLKEIPKEISLLSSLQELNLSKNNLQELPIEITQLRNLKTLVLSGNTIGKKLCTFLKDKLPKECTLVL